MNLPPDDDDRALRIDMLPAIDVIFAILALTIVASATLTRLEGLPVALPRASQAEPQDLPDATITIAATGEIQLDGETVEIDALVSRVGDRRKAILRADANVPHGQVVAVLDRLRQVENLQLAIGTEPATMP
ncbi:MAG: ExbD/TolR family protein [Geitlerinemataceae cyanobacterium]